MRAVKPLMSTQFALDTLGHCLANLHPHPPSGVFIHRKVAGELASREPLLGVQNERDGQEPFLQWQMGMVKYGADRHAKGCVAVIAMVALFLGCRTGPI